MAEVFNRFKAREYWKQTRAEWVKVAEQIGKVIADIEDPELKDVVLMILKAIAHRRGEFALNHTPDGFALEAFDFDDDVYDEIIAKYGEDYDFEPSRTWIISLVKGLPATFVGWAFGPLKAQLPGVRAEDRNMVRFSHGRIVYSVEKKALEGVLSHPDINHPKCKVIVLDMT